MTPLAWKMIVWGKVMAIAIIILSPMMPDPRWPACFGVGCVGLSALMLTSAIAKPRTGTPPQGKSR